MSPVLIGGNTSDIKRPNAAGPIEDVKRVARGGHEHVGSAGGVDQRHVEPTGQRRAAIHDVQLVVLRRVDAADLNGQRAGQVLYIVATVDGNHTRR